MIRALEGERGGVGFWLLAVLGGCLLIGPILLHFAQKSHNVLPLAVDESFPPESEIVPGEAFASTLQAIVAHELDGPTGWRPNDFFLWGPSLMADNNANRQMGILRTVQDSTTVMRNHLTKVSSSEFDQNLLEADTDFRNDPMKFWLPSAEGKFRSGAILLGKYVEGLRAGSPTSKPMNLRNVEAIRLFQAWTDILGAAHADLYKTEEPNGGSVPPWKTDDYFYYAQGNAHAMYYLCLALRREYQSELGERPIIAQLFDEAADALRHASLLKPIVVLDGGAASVMANHRRNLAIFVGEARQKMYSIREELEK